MKKTNNVMSKFGKWLLVFGIVFSQLSFPLNVLAEEIIENFEEEDTVLDTNLDDMLVLDNEADENINYDVEEELVPGDNEENTIITINGEDTDNYTIVNGSSVTVTVISDNASEEYVLDFSNRLYGTYKYSIESINKDITINYEGNNIELLDNYKLLDVVKYDSSNIVVTSDADINSIYNMEEFKTNYNAVVTIDGNVLEISDNNQDNLVRVSNNDRYTVNKLGDVNQDGIIDSKDQEAILVDIRNNNYNVINDINGDGDLNILDATNNIFGYNISEEEAEVLNAEILSDGSVNYVGDEIKVSFRLSGFDASLLYGMEGLINFDDSILELVSVNINGNESLGSLNIDNNKFAYVMDGYNANDEDLLVLTFKAIGLGDSDIAISNLVLSNNNLESDTVSTSISIIEDAKGGDVEEDVIYEELKSSTTAEENAPVQNMVKTTNSDESTYSEDDEVKEESKAIKSNKKKSVDEEDKKSNSSKTIIIILIILVIIGLIYIIFKDDEEDNDNANNNKSDKK